MLNPWTDEPCTWESCYYLSLFAHWPSKTPNRVFLVLFAISMVLYIVQGLLRREWRGFTIAMVCGCALEVIGYVGRVLGSHNPFDEVSLSCSLVNTIRLIVLMLMLQNPFLVQIVCLTIGPAFLAAGIYLCLARIVVTFGVENSRIRARLYPRIFIPCDIFSLVLQAGGGGYSSVQAHQKKRSNIGNNVMLAGLVVQVATLFVFILLALDFSIRTILRVKRLGANNALDSHHAALRKSWQFKGFLAALTLSTLLIFARCVYRIAELSEGWSGPLIKKEGLFIALEGTVVLIAVYLLNFFHPGFCFNESLETAARGEPLEPRTEGRTWYGSKRNVGVEEHSLESIQAGK